MFVHGIGVYLKGAVHTFEGLLKDIMILHINRIKSSCTKIFFLRIFCSIELSY